MSSNYTKCCSPRISELSRLVVQKILDEIASFQTNENTQIDKPIEREETRCIAHQVAIATWQGVGSGGARKKSFPSIPSIERQPASSIVTGLQQYVRERTWNSELTTLTRFAARSLIN